MHPRKWAVLHQSKQTLGYVERKPLSFTRSTTNQKGWKEKSKRKPALTPENFLCVQLFFFLTPALLLGSIFYSLISSDLMLTWAKPSLLLFFLVTEGCFNMYSMAVVCTWLCVSVRQTSYTQPQTLDLHTLGICKLPAAWSEGVVWTAVPAEILVPYRMGDHLVPFSVSLPCKANLL